MQYANMQKARFLSRPNRFIAHVEIDGREEIAHVKNTGRCKELLVPGATVYVQHHDDPKRKTKYSLIAVEKGDLLINMDSQAPNKVVQEWLLEQEPFGKIVRLKPECKYGDSRFDFYLETTERKMFIEVKGVTLEEDGVVLFPDAPTERGVKHVEELCHAIHEGCGAAVVFVVQMEGMRYFTPNRRTHAAFADALAKAAGAGVQIMAVTCAVTPETLHIDGTLPVKL
ncbi:DNA/RNA nuclease SfsA [Phascolarctobacterium sp.]|uniref:DNA/RNA nuclease SfsA n=1 Tax=Phascolarctobacterium sp. TaxID=2049039 RepID=UPI003863BF87